VVIYIVIPVLGYLRQEDTEFKVILDYIVRPFSKKKKKERKENISGISGWFLNPMASVLLKDIQRRRYKWEGNV
jgi:hypothetical protein